MTASEPLPSLYHDYGWFYDSVSRDRPGEVEFYRRVALTDSASPGVGGSTIELACGSGRLLAPLRAAGAEVWGVDAEPGMLARADHRLAAIPQPAPYRLILGDLRSPVGRAGFDLVILALDALRLTADLPGLLDHCRSLLRRGGLLAADVTLAAAGTRATLGPLPHPDGGATTAAVTWRSDDAWDVEHTVLTTQQPGEPPRHDTVEDRFRRLTAARLRVALLAAGFGVTGWHADFAGRAWQPGDGLLVVTARRDA